MKCVMFYEPAADGLTKVQANYPGHKARVDEFVRRGVLLIIRSRARGSGRAIVSRSSRSSRWPIVGTISLLAVLSANWAVAQSAISAEGTFLTDDGVRLYYRQVGRGPEVVIVPLAAWLSPHLDRLATSNRRIVYYDPRGRGRSETGDLARVSLTRATKDLEGLRGSLGVERMALVGWSGYGLEMAAYAFAHPDRVTRLVQLNPVPPRQQPHMTARQTRMRDRIDAEAWALFQSLAKDGTRPNETCLAEARAMAPAFSAKPEIALKATERLCGLEAEWPDRRQKFFAAFMPSIAQLDLRPRIPELKMPRLIIHGEHDLIPLDGVREWLQADGNAAELLVVPGADHASFLDQPDAVLSALNEFLERRQQTPPSVPGGMRGAPEALETARLMIERLGGVDVWARATALHVIEEVYRVGERHAGRSETWRSLTDARIWGRSESPESRQSFAFTPDAGWRLSEGALTVLSDVELLEWTGRWRRNIYVMYHLLAGGDPGLRVALDSERRLVAYDAHSGERLCWFEVNAGGEITKWGAAFGSGSEEWVYGPLVDMGAVRMPSWGTRVDGSYRFRYVSVRLTDSPPPVSFDPPAQAKEPAR